MSNLVCKLLESVTFHLLTVAQKIIFQGFVIICFYALMLGSPGSVGYGCANISFVMYVRLSAWNNLGPNKRILMKVDI
jgi:hypothetical protein